MILFQNKILPFVKCVTKFPQFPLLRSLPQLQSGLQWLVPVPKALFCFLVRGFSTMCRVCMPRREEKMLFWLISNSDETRVVNITTTTDNL